MRFGYITKVLLLASLCGFFVFACRVSFLVDSVVFVCFLSMVVHQLVVILVFSQKKLHIWKKIIYLGSNKTHLYIRMHHCVAWEGDSRPHTGPAATWERPSLASHSLDKELDFSTLSPSGEHSGAYGWGIAPCVVRGPIPVSDMRPWNWVRKGRETRRCRQWSVWLCLEFQNNGLS